MSLQRVIDKTEIIDNREGKERSFLDGDQKFLKSVVDGYSQEVVLNYLRFPPLLLTR